MHVVLSWVLPLADGLCLIVPMAARDHIIGSAQLEPLL